MITVHRMMIFSTFFYHSELCFSFVPTLFFIGFSKNTEFTNIKELTPGMLGILEPDPAKHAEVAISDIDIFLCPGLAFGRDCTRLGHGGGFYDRTLAPLQRSKTDTQVLGVAHNCQLATTSLNSENFRYN